jgi:hypothetical protein
MLTVSMPAGVPRAAGESGHFYFGETGHFYLGTTPLLNRSNVIGPRVTASLSYPPIAKVIHEVLAKALRWPSSR